MLFRSFFNDNSIYNSSLCTISSIYATVAYKYNSFDYLDPNANKYYAEQLMKLHGMKDIDSIHVTGKSTCGLDSDQHITDIIIGHRIVKYRNQAKDIIQVVIRGTGESLYDSNSSIKEWSSNFDIGCESIYENTGIIPRSKDWVIEENNMGFEIGRAHV